MRCSHTANPRSEGYVMAGLGCQQPYLGTVAGDSEDGFVLRPALVLEPVADLLPSADEGDAVH